MSKHIKSNRKIAAVLFAALFFIAASVLFDQGEIAGGIFVMLFTMLFTWGYVSEYRVQKEFQSAVEGQNPNVEIEQEPSKPAEFIEKFEFVILDTDDLADVREYAASKWSILFNRFVSLSNNYRNGALVLIALNFGLLVMHTSLGGVASYFDIFFVGTVISSVTFLFFPAPKFEITPNIRARIVVHFFWMVLPVGVGVYDLVVKPEFNSIVLFVLGLLITLLGFYFQNVRLKRLQERNTTEYIPPEDHELLFLWVFRTDAAIDFVTNIGYKWSFIAPVMFLGGEGLMDNSASIKFKKAGMRERSLVVRSTEEVEKYFQAFSYSPGKGGVYERQTMLCDDRTWKHALNTFFDRKNFVLMSLCGFTRENRGCEYELGKLINEVHTSQFILMYDDSTDLEAVLEKLEECWNLMVEQSPNSGRNAHPIQLFKLKAPKMPADNENVSARKNQEIMRQRSEEGSLIIQLLIGRAEKHRNISIK